MSDQFEPIQIVSLDTASSNSPDPDSELMDVVLKLSASAPEKWADYFNASWKRRLYGCKRNVRVSGKDLIIHCMPDELEKEHLPQLSQAIGETNNQYQYFLNEQKREDEARSARENRKRAKLEEVKQKLRI